MGGVAADQMLLRPRIYALGGSAGIARLDARLAEVHASAVNGASLQVTTYERAESVLNAQAHPSLTQGVELYLLCLCKSGAAQRDLPVPALAICAASVIFSLAGFD